jgi:hypothetical protein
VQLMPRKQVLRFAQDLGCGLTPARRLDLLNLFPASTLQVFQFIRRLSSSSCVLQGAETGRMHG